MSNSSGGCGNHGSGSRGLIIMYSDLNQKSCFMIKVTSKQSTGTGLSKTKRRPQNGEKLKLQIDKIQL